MEKSATVEPPYIAYPITRDLHTWWSCIHKKKALLGIFNPLFASPCVFPPALNPSDLDHFFFLFPTCLFVGVCFFGFDLCVLISSL